MSEIATLVSTAEYFSTDYEPDLDYVDGVLEDRNVGEREHSRWVRELIFCVCDRFGTEKLHLFPGCRMRVASRRYPLPDIGVVTGDEPADSILTTPPLLCIEMLSPEDRISRMQVKIDDYLQFGAAYVSVVDPALQRGWVYTRDSIIEGADRIHTSNPDLAVPISSL